MMTIPFEDLDPQHRGVKEWSRRVRAASMTWEVMQRLAAPFKLRAAVQFD